MHLGGGGGELPGFGGGDEVADLPDAEVHESFSGSVPKD
jgi:hypothetical protein